MSQMYSFDGHFGFMQIIKKSNGKKFFNTAIRNNKSRIRVRVNYLHVKICRNGIVTLVTFDVDHIKNFT